MTDPENPRLLFRNTEAIFQVSESSERRLRDYCDGEPDRAVRFESMAIRMEAESPELHSHLEELIEGWDLNIRDAENFCDGYVTVFTLLSYHAEEIEKYIPNMDELKTDKQAKDKPPSIEDKFYQDGKAVITDTNKHLLAGIEESIACLPENIDKDMFWVGGIYIYHMLYENCHLEDMLRDYKKRSYEGPRRITGV
jgi:hypothetical protein